MADKEAEVREERKVVTSDLWVKRNLNKDYKYVSNARYVFTQEEFLFIFSAVRNIELNN